MVFIMLIKNQELLSIWLSWVPHCAMCTGRWLFTSGYRSHTTICLGFGSGNLDLHHLDPMGIVSKSLISLSIATVCGQNMSKQHVAMNHSSQERNRITWLLAKKKKLVRCVVAKNLDWKLLLDSGNDLLYLSCSRWWEDFPKKSNN